MYENENENESPLSFHGYNDAAILEQARLFLEFCHDKNINDYSTEGACKQALKAVNGIFLKYSESKEEGS